MGFKRFVFIFPGTGEDIVQANQDKLFDSKPSQSTIPKLDKNPIIGFKPPFANQKKTTADIYKPPPSSLEKPLLLDVAQGIGAPNMNPAYMDEQGNIEESTSKLTQMFRVFRTFVGGQGAKNNVDLFMETVKKNLVLNQDKKVAEKQLASNQNEALEKPLVPNEGTDNRPVIVLNGYSRGACEAILMAQKLYKEYGETVNVIINIHDPVPGPLNREDKILIPPNVSSLTITYSGQETKPFLSPYDLNDFYYDPEKTTITAIPLKMNHLFESEGDEDIEVIKDNNAKMLTAVNQTMWNAIDNVKDKSSKEHAMGDIGNNTYQDGKGEDLREHRLIAFATDIEKNKSLPPQLKQFHQSLREEAFAGNKIASEAKHVISFPNNALTDPADRAALVASSANTKKFQEKLLALHLKEFANAYHPVKKDGKITDYEQQIKDMFLHPEFEKWLASYIRDEEEKPAINELKAQQKQQKLDTLHALQILLNENKDLIAKFGASKKIDELNASQIKFFTKHADMFKQVLKIKKQDDKQKQFERGNTVWKAFLDETDSKNKVREERKDICKRFFLLLQQGDIKYKNNPNESYQSVAETNEASVKKGEAPISYFNLASHGGRILMQIPQLDDNNQDPELLLKWLLTGNVNASQHDMNETLSKNMDNLDQFAVGTRTYATHGTKIITNDEGFKEVEEVLYKPTDFRVLRGRHYGVRLGLGDPDTKLDDGTNGHLYIYYRPPTKDEPGALMVGCEGSDPGLTSRYGDKHSIKGKSHEISGAGCVKYRDPMFEDDSVKPGINGLRKDLTSEQLKNIETLSVADFNSEVAAKGVESELYGVAIAIEPGLSYFRNQFNDIKNIEKKDLQTALKDTDDPQIKLMAQKWKYCFHRDNDAVPKNLDPSQIKTSQFELIELRNIDGMKDAIRNIHTLQDKLKKIDAQIKELQDWRGDKKNKEYKLICHQLQNAKIDLTQALQKEQKTLAGFDKEMVEQILSAPEEKFAPKDKVNWMIANLILQLEMLEKNPNSVIDRKIQFLSDLQNSNLDALEKIIMLKDFSKNLLSADKLTKKIHAETVNLCDIVINNFENQRNLNEEIRISIRDAKHIVRSNNKEIKGEDLINYSLNEVQVSYREMLDLLAKQRDFLIGPDAIENEKRIHKYNEALYVINTMLREFNECGIIATKDCIGSKIQSATKINESDLPKHTQKFLNDLRQLAKRTNLQTKMQSHFVSLQPVQKNVSSVKNSSEPPLEETHNSVSFTRNK